MNFNPGLRIALLTFVLGLAGCGQIDVDIEGQTTAPDLQPTEPPTEGSPPQEQNGTNNPYPDQGYLDKITPYPASSSGTWQIYDNPQYGFAFQYPDSWSLKVIPGGAREPQPQPPFADSISLRKEGYELVLWFQKAGENRSFLQMVNSGDRVDAGEIPFLGESIPRVLIHQEGVEVAILYGDEHFYAGDLHFAITLLRGSGAASGQPAIPESLQGEAERMLASLVASGVDSTAP